MMSLNRGSLLVGVGFTLATMFAPAHATPCLRTARCCRSRRRRPPPSAGLTMADSTYKKRVEPRRLAEGAPNILIILMDDVGPGTPSTYGGEINTPTLGPRGERWASPTTASTPRPCARRRAASLLTGRNHTCVGNGQISAIANDFDGFSGTIPKSSATVAEVLKDYGYNTGAWGKWHNTPEEQITSKVRSTIGPPATGSSTSRFPRRRGVAVRADADAQHHRGHRSRSPKGYHLTEDIATGRNQVAARTEGICARQAVLHVLGAGRVAWPASGAARSGPTSTKASSTTAGTSIASEPSCGQRQKGWIPQNAQLTPRPASMASWDSIPEDGEDLSSAG